KPAGRATPGVVYPRPAATGIFASPSVVRVRRPQIEPCPSPRGTLARKRFAHNCKVASFLCGFQTSNRHCASGPRTSKRPATHGTTSDLTAREAKLMLDHVSA